MAQLHHLKTWLPCAALAAFCAASSSAQPAAAAAGQAQDSAPATAAASRASGGKAPQAGEYITKKGWGRLLLQNTQGPMKFSLESTSGEDMCELGGTLDGTKGIAKSDDGSDACKVIFTPTAQGIEVKAATPAECRDFCGYNGSFQAEYLHVPEGCGRDALDRTRTTFKRLYDSRDYKAALATLAPALDKCQPTLEWREEGGMRNDLAITQYRNGLYAQCLATLAPYAEDARKDDNAVTEGWTPMLADDYLSIVRAARTNLRLCRSKQASR
ncbi:hypothetical protein [Xanthomonas medicagonis]|uniref:hypothetical protein n=1 Tax=Xanthomonas medicagonis TaxID=3160841 RepID=UPI0035156B54